MRTKTDGKLEAMVVFADTNAPMFKGPDGHAPAVERFDGPRGRGFFVCYDDETTGALVSIEWKAGRTSTKVIVQNKQLRPYEAASAADLLRIASSFAALLEIQG